MSIQPLSVVPSLPVVPEDADPFFDSLPALANATELYDYLAFRGSRVIPARTVVPATDEEFRAVLTAGTLCVDADPVEVVLVRTVLALSN